MIKANCILQKIIFFICILLVFCGRGMSSDIAVVTMVVSNDYSKNTQLGTVSKKEYCKIHGYDLYIIEESKDPSRPIPWSKIIAISEILKTNKYKYVFWTDADSMFMNYNIKLEQLIDDRYDFIVCKHERLVNTGQFFLKNTEWSLAFLEKIYSHTECINHIFWENQAVIKELETNIDVQNHTKILPARFMNSLAKTVRKNPNHHWHPGDFILHFASIRGEQLKESFNKNFPRIIRKMKTQSLDSYLKKHTYELSPLHSKKNQGYMTLPQKKQFITALNSYKNIKNVLEIGLNAGHSAETIINNRKDLESFYSFDINTHPYTGVAVKYFKTYYGARFQFFAGDSSITIPKFRSLNNTKMDLIYIDGCHHFNAVITDIKNCKALAHKETVLWLDDYHGIAEKRAIDFCVDRNIIEIIKVHNSCDSVTGPRCWVEARYCLSE